MSRWDFYKSNYRIWVGTSGKDNNLSRCKQFLARACIATSDRLRGLNSKDLNYLKYGNYILL